MYFRRAPTQRRRPVRRNMRRKKAYRGRKRQSTRIVTKINRSIPVPDRQFVKLRYTDVTTASSTAGLLSSVRIYRSSAYEPVLSSAHQPMWYDQYCPGMFSSYRCYGIAYRVTISPRDETNQYWFAIRPQNSATAETSLQSLLERPETKWRIGTPTSGSRSVIVIKGYMSVAKVRGISRNDVSTEDSFRATYNTNPALMGYLHMYLSSLTSGKTFDITAQLTYYLELGDRVTPGAS